MLSSCYNDYQTRSVYYNMKLTITNNHTKYNPTVVLFYPKGILWENTDVFDNIPINEYYNLTDMKISIFSTPIEFIILLNMIQHPYKTFDIDLKTLINITRAILRFPICPKIITQILQMGKELLLKESTRCSVGEGNVFRSLHLYQLYKEHESYTMLEFMINNFPVFLEDILILYEDYHNYKPLINKAIVKLRSTDNHINSKPIKFIHMKITKSKFFPKLLNDLIYS